MEISEKWHQTEFQTAGISVFFLKTAAINLRLQQEIYDNGASAVLRITVVSAELLAIPTREHDVGNQKGITF